MNLLGAALYDPAVAVSKSTATLLAMTAFDTTNLRLAITVPAHGKVLFKLRTTITGATTVPTVLLGVMNGATVIGRVTPQDFPGTMNAATQSCPCQCEFIATGLTPGAMNVDAAYAVQVIVASTNIKYGGPNTNAGNNAWGAFVFEAWDPQSQTANTTLAVDANGRVDVSKVAGTAQTARDLGAQLDAAVSSRMATYTQPTGFLAATFPTTVASTTNITAGTITTVTTLTNAPSDSAGTTTLLGRLTAGRATNLDNLDATISSRSTYAGGDTAGTTTLLTRLSAGRATNLDNLDAAVSTRSTYGGADTAGTTTLLSRLTALRATGLDNLDETVSSRLATAGYTAPDNANIALIVAKTNSLTFTVAGHLDVNILKVNGITVIGSGTEVDPWGPA